MAAVTGTLRVATWNLHEALPAREPAPPDVREAVAGLLTELRIDLAGLQEVDFGPDGASPTLDAIAGSTELRHVAAYDVSESSFHPGRRAGLAIVSRYPLSGVERHRFANPDLTAYVGGNEIGSHDKGFLAATARTPGGEVTAVTLHTLPFYLFGREAGDPEFQGMWRQLSEELRRLAKRPLVVCGDFNTPRRDLLAAAGAPELTRTTGAEPTYRETAADDILYSGGFTAARSGLVANFSDHALCFAELRPW
ncbi:endonuclease/exonuclease/phosphatase family protein [Bailinhaonella thermotolerans]|uniref:Endonuclease/exonuclease/phosphatase family protein n=1 Tax=Bailinhaonella thermotolerans TaxID=1070861 RepID=A0A3A4ARL0_9ACTN|nr:endonuclease/exonuclease/phosphatase family protein [Bailinhaonella thermotolerans]RJL32488.1 endonuclease/exonuclease/phosphatase family protein [Bailinhaonella thermotolerans]